MQNVEGISNFDTCDPHKESMLNEPHLQIAILVLYQKKK